MATEKAGDPAPAKPAGTTEEKPVGDPKPGEKPAEGAKPDEKPKPDEQPKPDDSAKPAGKEGAPPEQPKAPEKYALTIPEGGDVWLNDDDLKQLETIARKEGLDNEAAQALVDDHVAALAEQSKTFRAQVLADDTYGGDHFADTERFVKTVLDKVRPAGTPRGDALRSLLSKTGYGNHLEVISFLADLGKLMVEDTPARGGGGHGTPVKDAAEMLYGGTMGKSST